MRARMFMEMLKSARSIRLREDTENKIDGCHIAWIASNIKNHETVSKMFLDRVRTKRSEPKALPIEDPRTVEIARKAFAAAAQYYPQVKHG